MNTDWQKYWASRSTTNTISDALKQVGKTEFGEPISAHQIDLLIAHIVATLSLPTRFNALDLGCGNGLMTSALAEYANQISGLDYSPVLLETARTNYSRSNIEYEHVDLRHINQSARPKGIFDTGWSIEVVQNLDPKTLEALLDWIASIMQPRFQFLFSGIPDSSLKRTFYNTEQRWQTHLRNEKAGQEQMGRWWAQDELLELAKNLDMGLKIIPLPDTYYTSRYRFDALFFRDI